MNHIEIASKGKNHWWRYLIMVAVSLFGAQLLGGIPLGVLIAYKIKSHPDFQTPSNSMDFEAYGIDPILGFILALIPFVLSLYLFWVLINPIHGRRFTEVINGTNRIRWNRFFRGLLVWGGIIAVLSVLDVFVIEPGNYSLNFDITSFLPLLVVALLLLPVQTAFEEVLFRGYIAQGVGVLTTNRWMVVIIPSIFFALMHGLNPEVFKHGFGIMMLQYFLIAAVFALVSWFDDGIELAMGAHAANNIFLSLFVTAEESALQTPSVFKVIETNLYKDFVMLFVACLVFVILLTWKYRWNISHLVKDSKIRMR